MTANQVPQVEKKPLSPAAVVFVACGGGVVGYDYCRWFEVSPLIGAILGLVISAFAMKILTEIYNDPNNEIKKGCQVVGALLGAAIGFQSTNGSEDQFIAACIGGAIGAGLGTLAATMLSYAAIILLLISRGPIGFAIKSVIFN